MRHDTSNRKAAVAVLTVSDSRLLEDDRSGGIVVDTLQVAGHVVCKRELLKDDHEAITTVIKTWSADEIIHAIIITGGTGASRRDNTPEAVLPLFGATMPGFGELFRQLSYEEIGAAAMLSRAEAGWIDIGTKRTPVFLLPGSPNAVELAMHKLIVPQLGHLLDVCSMEQLQ